MAMNKFYENLPDNLSRIKHKYPKQFSAAMISCDWPDGWHQIVLAACEAESAVHQDLMWIQIKEKFGELRMYSNLDETLESVALAVEKSKTTCMSCGSPGVKAFSPRAWRVVLCEACRIEAGYSAVRSEGRSI
jgi:hypothetical protein